MEKLIKRALLGDHEAAKRLTEAGPPQKPKEARERIEALMGDVPRIELFARERIPGWDCWGDEVC